MKEKTERRHREKKEGDREMREINNEREGESVCVCVSRWFSL